MAERTYLKAAHTVECARSLVIDASHQMPSDAPKEIIQGWVALDKALAEFAETLHRAEMLGIGAVA